MTKISRELALATLKTINACMSALDGPDIDSPQAGAALQDASLAPTHAGPPESATPILNHTLEKPTQPAFPPVTSVPAAEPSQSARAPQGRTSAEPTAAPSHHEMHDSGEGSAPTPVPQGVHDSTPTKPLSSSAIQHTPGVTGRAVDAQRRQAIARHALGESAILQDKLRDQIKDALLEDANRNGAAPIAKAALVADYLATTLAAHEREAGGQYYFHPLMVHRGIWDLDEATAHEQISTSHFTYSLHGKGEKRAKHERTKARGLHQKMITSIDHSRGLLASEGIEVVELSTPDLRTLQESHPAILEERCMKTACRSVFELRRFSDPPN